MKLEQKTKKLDKRLEKRHKQMEGLMINKSTAVINQLAGSRAETVALCRFINNDKVTMDYLIKAETKKVNELSLGKHVLIVNDTTQLNYQAHESYLSKTDKDLGPIGNDIDIGLFVHPGLVIDTSNSMAIGFSYLHIWNREWKEAGRSKRNNKWIPIEEKESNRWIQCGQQSKLILPSALMKTIVADRESDIFEEFVLVPDANTHLLIRAKHNRKLVEGDTLNQRLENTSATHAFNLTVRTTKNRTGRETMLHVKYSQITILKPKNKLFPKDIPEQITLNVVEACEAQTHVPSGEKPIHWVLITTHKVESNQDAMQIITWYAMRWQIELLFNTLKTAALHIEDSQLETGAALKKLCVMSLHAALKINQLRQARNDQTEVPASITFTKVQIELIKNLIPQYEGKTEKQKNHYKENTLKWAGWLIARLGGWKGYAKESPPGNKTFKWGLDRFFAMETGYKLNKKMCA